ncbi:MAG: peptide ABC transporter permease [Thermoplasmata archaeon M9B2D]|nr:MAG: peptide ABC transporter permease [Thermoplasmata archaeon M8B2D]PNX51123.1 MAG: peptide ABC transporter permease [Thermoplasmata archaeon M9B2D]
MKTWEFIVRRLLLLIPVLIGVTIITFTVSHVIPADPARAFAGGPKAQPDVIERITKELHLDEPIWIQYFYYLNNLIHFDLGKSYLESRPVAEALGQYFPATLELTIFAMLIAIPLGILGGIISAVRRNKLSDHLTRIIAIVGYSLPIFWLALMLQYLLAYLIPIFPLEGRLAIGMNPPTSITGLYVFDSILTGNLNTLGSTLIHLVLPAFTLGFATLALILRMTRSSMLEVMGMDYIRTGRAKGLSNRKIIYKHALRNALIPTITVTGLAFGGLLGGAVLTETIFNWPGMGRFAARAVLGFDFNAVMGFTIVIAIIYVIANLVVDILYAVIDPRVKLGGG